MDDEKDFASHSNSVVILDLPANKKKGKQGFASMSSIEQRKIASKGGKAAHAKGTAHEWDSQEAKAAGRKGGKA